MSATFDATTTAEYAAASTAAARSALIVAALTGTISVKVFNALDVEMGSGTMDSPWATASGDTVTVGEVTSFTVGTTATPDADWYIRFQNADVSRWVRGSFGLSSSSQDFTWSLATWTATHTGTIGTATITTSGNTAPAFTVAPTAVSLSSAGGTIQFTASDADGDPLVYALTTTRYGITINSTTGLVTVTAVAAGTSGNIVVTASDGILSATATCAVTVSEVAGRTVEGSISLTSAGLLANANADGVLIGTLPETQTAWNADYIGPGGASGTIGGCGPATSYDLRVVASGSTVGADTVTAREGTHFLRGQMVLSKDYGALNGATVADDPVDDKPRWWAQLSHSSKEFNFDTETYFGFSIWLPTDWEHETGITSVNGNVSLLSLIAGGSTTRTQLMLGLWTDDSLGQSATHWNIEVADSDTVTTEAGNKTVYELGSVITDADLGKWTDIVIRARFNPFATATNPYPGITSSVNTTYQANRGILQVWKSTGALLGTSTYRTMERRFNRINTPVGLVPYGTSGVDNGIQQNWPKGYKPGWKKSFSGQTSDVAGPIVFAWSACRWGRATIGTTLADVAPNNEAQVLT